MKTHEQSAQELEDFLDTLPLNYPRLIKCVGNSFHSADGRFYTGSFKCPKEAYYSVQSRRVKEGLPLTIANARTRTLSDEQKKQKDRLSKAYEIYLNGKYKATFYIWEDAVAMFDVTLKNIPYQIDKEKNYTTPRNMTLTIKYN